MRALSILGCVAIATLLTGTAGADATRACTREKLSAAARAVRARIACQVRAVRAGSSVDADCVQRSVTRLAAAFARADGRGTCPGVAAAVGDGIDFGLGTLLRRVRGSGPCPARKLAAAGHEVAQRLECRHRAPDRVLPCFARVDGRFVERFARADRDGPCDGDAGTVGSLADAFATDVGTPIAGPPPSTTSTTTTTLAGTCGNGVVDAGEECDGQSYCTAACRFGTTACCVGSADAAFCIDFLPSRQSCLSCLGYGHGACVPGVCAGLACEDRPIAPVHVCCQFTPGCATDVATSIAALGALYSECAGEGLGFGIGVCGVDRVCHPGG